MLLYSTKEEWKALKYYVGKTYVVDSRTIKVELLMDSTFGAFYVMRWTDTDMMFCASPLEILVQITDTEN